MAVSFPVIWFTIITKNLCDIVFISEYINKVISVLDPNKAHEHV